MPSISSSVVRLAALTALAVAATSATFTFAFVEDEAANAGRASSAEVALVAGSPAESRLDATRLRPGGSARSGLIDLVNDGEAVLEPHLAVRGLNDAPDLAGELDLTIERCQASAPSPCTAPELLGTRRIGALLDPAASDVEVGPALAPGARRRYRISLRWVDEGGPTPAFETKRDLILRWKGRTG